MAVQVREARPGVGGTSPGTGSAFAFAVPLHARAFTHPKIHACGRAWAFRVENSVRYYRELPYSNNDNDNFIFFCDTLHDCKIRHQKKLTSSG
eukprot:COSAG02_NODE_778_length_17288_cov_102.024725_15_plen_93_part_00